MLELTDLKEQKVNTTFVYEIKLNQWKSYIKMGNIVYFPEGALKIPMAYDNHPIRHIALNELNRPKIELNRPLMT